MDERTKPKKRDVDPVKDKHLLVAGRYGTREMCKIWGSDRTYEYSLNVQAYSAYILSQMHPDILPLMQADEIVNAVTGGSVSLDRIRVLEEKKGHDVIAINEALGEVVSPSAASHINKAKTSADTTEAAKAWQCKDSLEVIADSIENLRDIILERAYLDWADIPHQDTTHLYDALPTIAGRPFAFYAEMLQTDLERIAYVYNTSLIGKWADATGNHHSAKALGIDGILLQQEFCKSIDIGCMIAPAQIPGREYIFDIASVLTRTAGTIAGLAHYIRMMRGDDAGIFTFPRGKKGSSAMPHKDSKGGNPTAEEQAESYFRKMVGDLTTIASTIPFDYGRDLTGSASDRICLDEMFKWSDHIIRNMADVVYKLQIDAERSKARVLRSYGVTTAQQVMTYLTDIQRTKNPMTRTAAHDLTGFLAQKAYDGKRQFVDVCLDNVDVMNTLGEETIREITDPLKYIGESKRILQMVYDAYHKKKTELKPFGK